MVGWHHQLNGHEFEQTMENSEGQGAWCAAVHEVAESDTPQRLNNKSELGECFLREVWTANLVSRLNGSSF